MKEVKVMHCRGKKLGQGRWRERRWRRTDGDCIDTNKAICHQHQHHHHVGGEVVLWIPTIMEVLVRPVIAEAKVLVSTPLLSKGQDMDMERAYIGIE